MKVVQKSAGRTIFSGAIASGTGEHSYTCGKCSTAILRNVDVRHPSAAVYQCPKCEAFNVVGRMDRAPEEVAERFTRLYSEHSEVPARDRRKAPR